jgi:transposase-like protein
MKRIMLSVTEQQGEWLKATARQHGLGIAELLRRIIDSWRETSPHPSPSATSTGRE